MDFGYQKFSSNKQSIEIVVYSKDSLFQKKLYHFNWNSQIRIVMQRIIQLDLRSRSRTKKYDSDS